jgi:hypothetical protein
MTHRRVRNRAAAPAGLISAIAILLVVVATDAWVYVDAARQRERANPLSS